MLETGGKKIHLVTDNELHHVPNPKTYETLFKDWKHEELPDLSAFIMSYPLSDGAKLLSDKGTIFLVSND